MNKFKIKKKQKYIQKTMLTIKTEIVKDSFDNEYVLLKDDLPIEITKNITDKTQFEGSINHIHLLDNIKEKDLPALGIIAISSIEMLDKYLKTIYPDKHFYIYVSLTISDSMIIRFHQEWCDESPFYGVGSVDDNTILIIRKNNDNGFYFERGINIKCPELNN